MGFLLTRNNTHVNDNDNDTDRILQCHVRATNFSHAKKPCQTKLLIKNGNMMVFCNINYKLCNIYSSRGVQIYVDSMF